MATNVYLLITDLHLANNKENRINYLNEIMSAISQIASIADKYKSKEYTVNCILMGDVFDGSFTSPEISMSLLELLKLLLSLFDKSYSLIGNHEISYQRNNPFWYMISRIDDEEVFSVKRVIQPKGMFNYFDVPDTIIDGNVTFYFNHFGIPPKTATGDGIKIGLFHQNIGSTSLGKMWGGFDDVEKVSYIQSYNYSFIGHLHTIKGSYWIDPNHKCKVEWLGSIGRTSTNELFDGNYEVNVPAILIKDGEFKTIEDNLITLPDFNQCVDLKSYEKSKSAREKIKEVKNSYTGIIYSGDTLLEAVFKRFEGNYLSEILNLCYQSEEDMYHIYNQILQSCESGELIE